MAGLKVAIDIRVEPGMAGGTAPALRSLVRALGALEDGPEQYVLVIQADTVDPDRVQEWLGPPAANQSFTLRWHPGWPTGKYAPPPPAPPPWGPKRLVNAVRRRLVPPAPPPPPPAKGQWPLVPISEGFYEALGCDLVHFPTQNFTVTALPSVYNPHDLQHLHYPQFFSIEEITWRETVYPAACHFAQAVIVNSNWIKNDVVRKYATDPAKVHVVAEAPPELLGRAAAAPDQAALRQKYALASRFAFYPGVTWPHKNHVRLLEAIAYLRDQRGLIVNLVCTGAREPRGWSQIEAKLAELSLSDQVKFLGFVSDEELHGLYNLATCLVMPSLFEANSLPVFEAWHHGVPVACSSSSAMPEQIGDAGLLFDALDPKSIAAALERLFTDEVVAAALRAKGLERTTAFSWSRTAKGYRAIYRQLAGRTLNEEDRLLLQSF